jgi:hypothetical protein
MNVFENRIAEVEKLINDLREVIIAINIDIEGGTLTPDESQQKLIDLYAENGRKLLEEEKRLKSKFGK